MVLRLNSTFVYRNKKNIFLSLVIAIKLKIKKNIFYIWQNKQHILCEKIFLVGDNVECNYVLKYVKLKFSVMLAKNLDAHFLRSFNQ